MKSNISRRTALAAISTAGALTAIPVSAIAAAQGFDRTAWDQAFRAYEKADAEDKAFNAIFDRLYEQYKEAEDKIPHIALRPDPFSGRPQPVSTADHFFVNRARSFVQEVTTGRAKLDPIPSLQDHLQLCRELIAAADERNAAVAAVRARYGMDEAEEKWEALGEARYKAEWALMDTPAPDTEALLFKLEKLLEVEQDGSTAPWAARAVAQTMADARRLLSNGKA